MELKQWRLEYEGRPSISCESPCSLYSVLLENGLMDDPFTGVNEYEATALSRRGCAFSSHFDVDEGMLCKEQILLVCHGLDTLCTLSLNGTVFGKAENMHRTYEWDVKALLVNGENELRLQFESPILFVEKMNERCKLWTGGETPGIPHIRKAAFMFGWDWGPKLPDMGLFRPVELMAFDGARLENVNIMQRHGAQGVRLDLELEGRGSLEQADVEAELRGGGETLKAKWKGTAGGLTVSNPKLWWPNGYGEQNLYTLTVRAFADGREAGSVTKTIGLRTLTVSTKEDAYGEEFCFVINGHKIFAMGANYIPQDNVLPRITREKTEALIQNCVAAHYNTLRVWGGGFYPDDSFYELCDRYGLIVWQDFMFACVNIRLSARFRENVQAELIDNVKRIRHHACLGLLCGNNEMEWGVDCWDIGANARIRADYLELYERMMPDTCEEYAPQVFYWPSSPSSGGGFSEPNEERKGDSHFWDVWLGDRPYTEYRKHYFRFCSEFGFEAFPSMKTIRSFAGEEDMNPFSQVMESHQKCGSGNSRILRNAADHYLYASNMELLVYMSQLMQADAIRFGVEHMRRHRGRCMGTCYWQLNDCWPVASWSSIDCFGRWKALHYAAKRFYAPVLLSAHEEGTDIVLNVSNETMSAFTGTLRYAVRDSGMRELFSGSLHFTAPQLAARDVLALDVAQYVGGAQDSRYFVCGMWDESGKPVSEQTVLFVPPKRFAFCNPEIEVEIHKDGDLTLFHTTASAYAKSVELDFTETDLVLSDNYFDITSHEGVTVSAKTSLPVEELIRQLTVRSVYDIR